MAGLAFVPIDFDYVLNAHQNAGSGIMPQRLAPC
jgi:hypothetical protein